MYPLVNGRRRCCELCKVADNQFVHDTRAGCWVCTLCGCVVRKWLYADDSKHNYSDTHTATQAVSTVHSVGRDRMERLLDKVHPGEARERRLHAIIDEVARILDVNERVRGRAAAIFARFPALKKQRHLPRIVAAAIIVAKRSLGEYVNMKEASREMECKLSVAVRKVLKETNISQGSLTMRAIPFFISQLGLPVAEERVLKDIFMRASRANGSIGSDTLMALCLFKFARKHHLHHVSIATVAELTNTSATSLTSYIRGKSHCTLFAG